MKKIFYITRSYLPSLSGGTIIRAGTIENLERLGYEIVVVTPNYKGKNIYQENNILYIPVRLKRMFTMPLEMIGIIEDYLDNWVTEAYRFLLSMVTRGDYVLATSGGELGCIKLASMLKDKTGCKALVNFHDPLDYSLVNGMKINNLFHVGREKQEHKYLKNMDLIITSSEYNRASLQSKYPEMKDKIKNNYFGYISNIDRKDSKPSNRLRIGYGGALGSAQRPGLLLEITKDIPEVEVFIIGDPNRLKKFGNNHPRSTFIPQMNHKNYINFIQENIDVGFVSLIGDYFGACVPSKIYEFINLCIPMLGALPSGDAKDIINNNRFGVACHYNDFKGLENAIYKLSDFDFRNEVINSMQQHKNEWSMSEKIKEVDNWLKEL